MNEENFETKKDLNVNNEMESDAVSKIAKENVSKDEKIKKQNKAIKWLLILLILSILAIITISLMQNGGNKTDLSEQLNQCNIKNKNITDSYDIALKGVVVDVAKYVTDNVTQEIAGQVYMNTNSCNSSIWVTFNNKTRELKDNKCLEQIASDMCNKTK